MGETRISVVKAGDIHVPAAATHEVIAAAPTGHEAVARALIEIPDVLVLEVGITEPDALGVCRRVREWAPATRILATTTAENDEHLHATLLAVAAAKATIFAADQATTTTIGTDTATVTPVDVDAATVSNITIDSATVSVV